MDKLIFPLPVKLLRCLCERNELVIFSDFQALLPRLFSPSPLNSSSEIKCSANCLNPTERFFSLIEFFSRYWLNNTTVSGVVAPWRTPTTETPFRVGLFLWTYFLQEFRVLVDLSSTQPELLFHFSSGLLPRCGSLSFSFSLRQLHLPTVWHFPTGNVVQIFTWTCPGNRLSFFIYSSCIIYASGEFTF